MTFNVDDDSEHQPIDLFAPLATVSQESYAFPIEDFQPGAKYDQPDEPASLTPLEVKNYEVNPNNPPGTVVDLVETTTIPEGVTLGVQEETPSVSNEAALDTDTPLSPLPDETADTIRISLEAEMDKLYLLNNAYRDLRSVGGITREDVKRIESIMPGVITEHRPLNQFSSVVSVAGYEVSCESIGGSVLTLIERIIAAIGRLIERIFGGLGSSTKVAEVAINLGDKWNKIEEKAAQLDAVRGRVDFSKYAPDSKVAKKSSTVRHFVKLYFAEVLADLTETTPNGYNLVITGEAYNALHLVERNIRDITTKLRQSVKGTSAVSFNTPEVGSFREQYTMQVKGISRPVEQLISVKSISGIVSNIERDVEDLKSIQSELQSRKNTLANDESASNALRSALNAIAAAEAYVTRMNIIVDSYRAFNNAVDMAMNRTATLVTRMKVIA